MQVSQATVLDNSNGVRETSQWMVSEKLPYSTPNFESKMNTDPQDPNPTPDDFQPHSTETMMQAKTLQKLPSDLCLPKPAKLLKLENSLLQVEQEQQIMYEQLICMDEQDYFTGKAIITFHT